RDIGRAARPCSALLRVGFAEPPESPRALVRSYRTVSPLPVPRGAIGGLFSVALSCGSPRLAVSQHPCPVESRPSSARSSRTATTRPARRLHSPTNRDHPPQMPAGLSAFSPLGTAKRSVSPQGPPRGPCARLDHRSVIGVVD